MAQSTLVTCELIKNPQVKRQFTLASAKFNSKKWRIVDEENPVQQEVKKKVVSPVAVKAESPEVVVSIGETANSFGNVASEFATISEEPNTKAALQKEYEDLSGTKPDGRWNEGKLKEKIEALKNPAQ